MTTKQISEQELAKHNKRGDLWVAIHGKVYDLTNFTDDHPGGDEVLYLAAGLEGTSNFEDVGHSPHARELMQKYEIGTYASGDPVKKQEERSTPAPSPSPSALETSNFPILSIVLAGITIAAILYKLY